MRPLRTKPIFIPATKRSFKPLLMPLLLIAVFALVGFFGLFYRAHALPNVQLASVGVGNKTLSELEEIARSQFQKIKFQFVSPTRTVTASAGELGAMLDTKKTAEQAYNLPRNLFDGLQLWRPLNSPLVIRYEYERIVQFLERHFGDEFTLPVDASLRFDETLGEFRAVEGKLGKGFVVSEILDVFSRQAWQPDTVMIHAKKTTEPERAAVSIAKTGDEANAIIRLRFGFTYQKKVMYVAEPSEIAAWLTFTSGSKPGQLAIAYDRHKIADFLEQKVRKSLNDFYGPEGSIPARDPTVRPAAEPLRLQMTDDLINDIIAAATKKTDIEKELKVIE